jgi:hypothetical protein
MVAAMTGGTLAWGIAFAALCFLLGMMTGWPLGHWRGLRHAAEDAEDAADAAIVAGWKGLPDEDARPSPPWPPAPPQAPRAGPGKHRHPPGPRHAALPAAGYLPAEPSRWAGQITVPAPVQRPPWDARPPEPPTEVLEPTAVLPGPVPDPLTDTGAFQLKLAEFQAYMDGLMKRSEADLKEITGGAR